MNLLIFLILFLLSFSVIANVSSQDNSKDAESKRLLILSDEELIFLFTTAILIVIGIFVYMARHNILRKKTDYEMSEFESQKNRDYEKYHSDWTSDDSNFKSKKYTKFDDEFRDAARESSLPNYYEILGISKDATQNEIKTRFRILAKELHPDKRRNSDTEETMSKINQAYEVLSDPERRGRYDKYLNVS